MSAVETGSEATDSMERAVKTIGVVGAGVMGTGVAQVAAQSGHRVVLLDVSDAVLADARAKITQAIRFQRMFDKSAPAVDAVKVLEAITFTTAYDAFAEADFVVENATERWAVKEPIYKSLDAACPEHTVFAANTSCIPITRIGGATNRADRVLGIHFMNPVPLKPTAEMIRGHHTTDRSIAIAKGVLKAMGKDCVVVNDAPGFVSNRVLMLTVNEAIFTVHDGVAEAADVDRIFKECFGHKMGPLETGDLIGLDTILQSLEVLYEEFCDSKYRPCPLLRKMVNAGLLGRKSGQGFYRY